MAKQQNNSVIIIKKYPNRCLYNTQTSCYIILQDLFDMIKRKELFEVIDAKTGENLTHLVLTQIILEKESKGHKLLSITFLLGLIDMYGKEQKEDILRQYLTSSMEYLLSNNDKFVENDALILKDQLQELTISGKK